MDFASGSKLERRIDGNKETWVFIAKTLSYSIFSVDFEGSAGIELIDLDQEVDNYVYILKYW